MNHGGQTLVDILLIAAAAILTVLLAATSYAASEYFKQLRKAKIEYEKARDTVEDIVLSFNRELRREAERIEAVSFRVEGTAAQAEAGLRKAGNIEERVTPLETKANQVITEVEAITSLVESLSESNTKMLEKVSSLDATAVDEKLHSFQSASNDKLVSVDSKVREIETSQAALRTKISGLEAQFQKLSATSTAGGEMGMSASVMPIRRDKAIASLTETEVVVLEFLVAEGSKTAPEIKEKVQLSREHTARLMKKLYEEGYLERETGKLPFRYSVKKEMEKLLRKPEPTTF
jgi:chromosome segregation ATPase